MKPDAAASTIVKSFSIAQEVSNGVDFGLARTWTRRPSKTATCRRHTARLWSMTTCATGTRVKQMTSFPFFEAGTEMFVRDYTKTSLRVVVRDARLREHDPILGIVDLPLQKTLAHASQATRTYSLQGGVGWVRVTARSCSRRSRPYA